MVTHRAILSNAVVLASLAFVGACSSAAVSTSDGVSSTATTNAASSFTVPSRLPLKFTGGPTQPAILAADMMTRVYILADDSMMGRSAATAYNAKGAAYIEREVRRLGLQPAGENGTYVQFPLEQRELAAG